MQKSDDSIWYVAFLLMMEGPRIFILCGSIILGPWVLSRQWVGKVRMCGRFYGLGLEMASIISHYISMARS